MSRPVYDTVFPTVTICPADIDALELLLLEKFQRHYPRLPLRKLKVADVAHEAKVTPKESVDRGFVAVDDLWGEAVPTELAGDWKQPHSDSVIDPIDPERFYDPISINVRVNKNPSEKTLLKWGIDRRVDLECRALQRQLRDLSTSIATGDIIIWRGHAYRVEYVDLAGRFEKTSYYLYADFLANAIRRGA